MNDSAPATMNLVYATGQANDAGETMLETFSILNEMVSEGVIQDYALCGAMAAFRYIEPSATRDMDVSVEMPGVSAVLLDFDRVVDFLRRRNLPVVWEDEGINIKGVPVQFIPAVEALDKGGLETAETVTEGGVSFKVWRAEYLMVKCVQIARPKDRIRLSQFLETRFDKTLFCHLVKKHGLQDQFGVICRQLGVEDLCGRT